MDFAAGSAGYAVARVWYSDPAPNALHNKPSLTHFVTPQEFGGQLCERTRAAVGLIAFRIR